MKPKNEIKTFVLDTNVLLHDPDCIYKFQENRVVIPVEALVELDNKKKVQGELGRSARQIHRNLRILFQTENCHPEEQNFSLRSVLPKKGELCLVINDGEIKEAPECEKLRKKLRSALITIDQPDHRILASALYLQEIKKIPNIILVTKDNNMAVKGHALGLNAQDYLNDKITTQELKEYRSIEIPYEAFDGLYRTFQKNDPKNNKPLENDRSFFLNLENFDLSNLETNEYLIFKCQEQSIPARHTGEGYFKDLPIYTEFNSSKGGSRNGLQMPKGVRVIPKNLEQWILMDAILNPDIKLVTCRGIAGTGKTFISIATAIAELFSEKTHYEKLYISRPVVQIGKDLGALPGELDAKIAPYMQPYFDNLEVLFSKPRRNNGDKTSKKPKVFGMREGSSSPNKNYQWLLDTNQVEIEAMTYIRGRSISNAIMIIDEAQNMTPHEAKTVVTRMAEDSKLILIGDPQQIDTPFIDAQSNGLVYVRERMKEVPIVAHVKLFEGVRSELSKFVANKM